MAPPPHMAPYTELLLVQGPTDEMTIATSLQILECFASRQKKAQPRYELTNGKEEYSATGYELQAVGFACGPSSKRTEHSGVNRLSYFCCG